MPKCLGNFFVRKWVEAPPAYDTYYNFEQNNVVNEISYSFCQIIAIFAFFDDRYGIICLSHVLNYQMIHIFKCS